MKNIEDNYLTIIEKIMKILPNMSKEEIIWYSRSDTDVLSERLTLDNGFEIIKQTDPEYIAIRPTPESTLLDLNQYLRKDFRFDYNNSNTNAHLYLKNYGSTERRVLSKYKTKCILSKEELIYLMRVDPEDRNICLTPAQIVKLIQFKVSIKDFRIYKENWIVPILDANHQITFIEFDNSTHELCRLFADPKKIIHSGYLFV